MFQLCSLLGYGTTWPNNAVRWLQDIWFCTHPSRCTEHRSLSCCSNIVVFCRMCGLQQYSNDSRIGKEGRLLCIHKFRGWGSNYWWPEKSDVIFHGISGTNVDNCASKPVILLSGWKGWIGGAVAHKQTHLQNSDQSNNHFAWRRQEDHQEGCGKKQWVESSWEQNDTIFITQLRQWKPTSALRPDRTGLFRDTN